VQHDVIFFIINAFDAEYLTNIKVMPKLVFNTNTTANADVKMSSVSTKILASICQSWVGNVSGHGVTSLVEYV